MADFLTAVATHASDFDRPDDAPGPARFKCRKRDQRVVDAGITEGQISNWQRMLWDLNQSTPSS